MAAASASPNAWSRLNWPQVVALAVTFGGAVLFAIFAPIDWATLPWEALIGGAVTIAGIVYGASNDRVVARPSSPPPPPRRVPAPKREGSVMPVTSATSEVPCSIANVARSFTSTPRQARGPELVNAWPSNAAAPSAASMLM